MNQHSLRCGYKDQFAEPFEKMKFMSDTKLAPRIISMNECMNVMNEEKAEKVKSFKYFSKPI